MLSGTNANLVNAVALPAENKLDVSLPGMVNGSQVPASGITINQPSEDFPVYNLASLVNFRELKEDKSNKYSHEVRLADDKQGGTWVVKRTMKGKVRELKRDKEKEKTAREVFFAEVARFLDPYLPEYRAAVDAEGNYYVLSRYLQFRSFNQIYAEEATFGQTTDYNVLINSGQLKGAARTGIINLLIIENDGGMHNVGLFRKPGFNNQDKDYHYVIGQIDRGQTGDRNYLKVFIKNQDSSKIDVMVASRPSSLNIEQNPVLNAPVNGAGYAPTFWMDVVADRIWETSYLFDDDTPNQPAVRAETNETLVNAALLTDDVIFALGARILGNYNKRSEFQNILINQRRLLLNAALLAHQDPLNPYMISCFRNYVAESKEAFVQNSKNHLSTFTTREQRLFEHVEAQEGLEKSIDKTFEVLTQRAIHYRELYGTGVSILPSSTPANSSALQQCWDCVTDNISACISCICPCLCNKKSAEPSQSQAVIKQAVEKKAAAEDVSIDAVGQVDRKNDTPVSAGGNVALQLARLPLAAGPVNQRPASQPLNSGRVQSKDVAKPQSRPRARSDGLEFFKRQKVERIFHIHHSAEQGEVASAALTAS